MPRSGAAELRVAGEDIDNVEIKLAGPFFVTVSTDWGISTPPDKPRLFTTFANLFALDGQAAGGMEIGTQARLIAFAGRYLVEPIAPTEPGYFLDALMLDNRDVRGQIVDLSGPTELKIVYKKGGGSVRDECSLWHLADGSPHPRDQFRCCIHGDSEGKGSRRLAGHADPGKRSNPACCSLRVSFENRLNRLRSLLAGLVLIAADMAVTLICIVPINKQAQSWNASAPPPDWAELRDRWEEFHTIRTALIVSGFSLFTSSVVFFRVH
jgi:hypothetical protein